MDLEDIAREYRQKYRQVFLSTIHSWDFVWRPLGRKEYKDLIHDYGFDKHRLEEEVCNTSILWPSGLDWEQVPAGIVPTLANQIVSESGFSQTEINTMKFEMYKSKLSSDFESQAEVIVKTAFPDVTFDIMANWTADELMLNLARAEWALRNIHGKPITLEKKQEEEEQEQPELADTITDMRANGLDPMIQLSSMIRISKPVMEIPFIAGTTAWKNEVILDATRQQIQGLSDGEASVPSLS